jgi:hypothetical protein
MIATIHDEAEFSELFMSYLLSRNSRIEEDLIDQLFNSSEKRLARLLLLLASLDWNVTSRAIGDLHQARSDSPLAGAHHPTLSSTMAWASAWPSSTSTNG